MHVVGNRSPNRKLCPRFLSYNTTRKVWLNWKQFLVPPNFNFNNVLEHGVTAPPPREGGGNCKIRQILPCDVQLRMHASGSLWMRCLIRTGHPCLQGSSRVGAGAWRKTKVTLGPPGWTLICELPQIWIHYFIKRQEKEGKTKPIFQHKRKIKTTTKIQTKCLFSSPFCYFSENLYR